MISDNITYTSYLGAGLCFMVLTSYSLYIFKKKNLQLSFIIASIISCFWSFAIAFHYETLSFSMKQLILLEMIRYIGWISATLFTLRDQIGRSILNKFIWQLQAAWIVLFTTILLLPTELFSSIPFSNTYIWLNLVLAICSIVAIEQLYKNSNKSRYIKVFSLIFCGLFSYDIFIFAYSLSHNEINIHLWNARGVINGLAALLMISAVTYLTNTKNKHNFSISRPAAFYTTSMTFSGIFLAIMALGSYYIQLYGGEWSKIFAITAIFLAALLSATLFISQNVRSILNVWINKHFFRHKYDYRVEWLKLIRSLSQPTTDEQFQTLAIKTLASTFKSPAGGLWLKDNKEFKLFAHHNLPQPSSCTEPTDSDFIAALREHEWIFSPEITDHKENNKLNSLIPNWILKIPNLWLVTPLFVERELLGFAILTKPKINHEITWEDLDLLKTVSRQIASYLDRHKAADLLAESRQFDTFHKLSAFIMHDLKNLIAQQALVVENATKHKDNPAFIEDAIKTIDNSVSRMSNLLKKLKQDEPQEFHAVELNSLLTEVTLKTQQSDPKPSFYRYHETINTNADPDRLLMILVNIVKNAQEATKNDGFIDITLSAEKNDSIIEIEDNGEGMSEDFIKHKLFKPFSSTKSGKGMGIGVYQTKEYIESLGGSIAVESEKKQGTKFIIKIPSIKV